MTAPTCSVVVASFRDAALLHACIASLESQCALAGAELLVARDAGCGDLDAFSAQYPRVRFVAAPAGSSVPLLRGVGMQHARAGTVVLAEDHCVARPNWLSSMLGGLAGASVAGGGMDNAQTDRALEWGAYFSEYGFFDANRVQDAGAAPLLTGANVVYAASVTPAVTQWMVEGAWENTIHLRLATEGHVMRFVPDAVIAQNMRYGLASFCRDRYVHGRDFARTRLRLSGTGAVRRAAMSLASPLLPALLIYRLWRMTTGGRRARRMQFLAAAPYTFVFLGAWSIGECVGYALGPDREAHAPSA